MLAIKENENIFLRNEKIVGLCFGLAFLKYRSQDLDLHVQGLHRMMIRRIDRREQGGQAGQ